MSNDKPKSTFHSIALAGIDDERGGRYAAEGSKRTVIGSSPVAYPAQPATSPWHHDPCSPEPPLGYSVEAQEPVDEMFERADAASTTVVGEPPPPPEQESRRHAPVDLAAGGGGRRRFARRA